MTKHLSTHEWENLSAYLDGELSSRDRARLEQSLQQRQDLQEALTEMRRTRMVLRATLPVRAPRNFTLTAAMVGQAKPKSQTWFAFNALRFSSALASILLVIAIIGEWLIFSGAPASPVAMMSEPPAEALFAPTEEVLAPDTDLGEDVLRQAATEDPSPKALMAPEASPEPGAELSAPAAELESPAEAPEATEIPPIGALVVGTPPVEEPRATEEVTLMQAAPAGEDITPEAETSYLPLMQQPEVGEAGESAETQLVEPDETRPVFNIRLLLRIAQIMLVLLAVTSAGLAILIRRNSR